MLSRSCAKHLRRVSQEYYFVGILNLNTFVELALRVIVRSSGRGREPPATTLTIASLIGQSSSFPASRAVRCFSLDTLPHLEY